MADHGLPAGLIAEYEALYALGVAGAHLTGAQLDAAKRSDQAHRDTRDAVLTRMSDSGAKVPEQQAAYRLPSQATDAKTAGRLISDIEDRTTRTWRAVVANTTGADRRAAARAMASSAVNLARWKRATGVSPSTTAFPGRH
ncbi:MAG TPA: ferritin-like domain-containing protein [Stackebrandtia sp.]|jgi:hypothetical protein|uniref:ferritin-like domain-containing protein n=1 Tax=Stackebrandtia sp. TaxID=2023065 RepID=UPI002D6EB65C|nr:ferritin-like domain-containing protein [Stackebrandtia sp.]HZE39632.1 ferritin-like domain-containing protein [Stackebrandtia sp.]